MADIVALNHGMSGRDPIALLCYEASKKPAIRELLDLIERDMFSVDLDAVRVPLPWFRKALSLYRDKIARERAISASEELANAMGGFEEVSHVGVVYRYIGPDMEVAYAGPPTTNRYELIHNRQIFLCNGVVWAGSTPLDIAISDLAVSDELLNIHRNDYIEMWKTV